MTLVLKPVTFRAAAAYVTEKHRHHAAPRGMKFCVGLENDGELVGVAIAGRPVARHLDDGFTIEVTRSCTDGTANANSMLYGALWRAAQALGYTRAVTYTMEGETGASLRGAGWDCDGPTGEKRDWSRPKRGRDEPVHPVGVVRYRWSKHTPSRRA